MCKRNDGIASACVLYFEKDFMPVQEIKEEPAYGQVAGIADDGTPVFRAQPGETAQEEIADAGEIHYGLCKVDCDGIHSDNTETQSPSLPSPDICKIIEKGEQTERIRCHQTYE